MYCIVVPQARFQKLDVRTAKKFESEVQPAFGNSGMDYALVTSLFIGRASTHEVPGCFGFYKFGTFQSLALVFYKIQIK